MKQAEDQREKILTVFNAFSIAGDFKDLYQWTDGHINQTFLATVRNSKEISRFVVQRINSHVFKNIEQLMDNAIRVSEHASRKLVESNGLSQEAIRRGTIRFLRSEDGLPFYRDPDGSGDVWRLYPYIEGATAYSVASSLDEAYEAAYAFGNFQNLIHDIPGQRLHETIVDFHNTPARFRQLDEAAASAVEDRLEVAMKELDEYRSRAGRAGTLQHAFAEGAFPERIVHNDAKLSNVLLDDVTHKGVCVIDLDTVMPGFALHDFGDLVRSICNPAAEDELDLSKVVMRPEYFRALVNGYLDAAENILTKREIELLPEAGWALTIECGSRFLADYLSGDKYFRTSRKNQNLDRARTQLRFAQSIEAAMPMLTDIVKNRN